jgi:ribonuclease HII
VAKGLTAEFEISLLKSGKYQRIIGIDEAGRGCWAGPVAVGAVVFTLDTPSLGGVNDSKKLTALQREQIFTQLQPHGLVKLATSQQIDELGIAKAIESLISELVATYQDPQTLFLIDGQFSTKWDANVKTVIKGDSTYYSIAGASILAKVTRDNLMTTLDKEFPVFQFSKHKGYGTQLHAQMLQQYGPTQQHRYSYAPVAKVAALFKK